MNYFLTTRILGASSDLKQATSIAQHMVRDWGMSEKVGLRTIEGQKGLMSSEALGPHTIEAVLTLSLPFKHPGLLFSCP